MQTHMLKTNWEVNKFHVKIYLKRNNLWEKHNIKTRDKQRENKYL